MPPELYSREWFQARSGGARRSAEVILPILFDFATPRRVVDVGCGTGSWLSVALGMGAEVLGIDGDYVDRRQLEIPADRFLAHDLTQRLRLEETYDLAICLEVGEHLPTSGSAALVQTLTGLAPIVAFSAAVPGQGGTGHVNEQWQDFWAAHFRAEGYEPVDLVRPRVWDDAGVRYFYAQNLLVYVDPARADAAAAAGAMPLRVVHPRLYDSARRRLPEPRDALHHARQAASARLGALAKRVRRA